MEEKKSKVVVLVAVGSLTVIALLLDHLGWQYTRLGQQIMAVLFVAVAIAFVDLQRFEKGFARAFSFTVVAFTVVGFFDALIRAIWLS